MNFLVFSDDWGVHPSSCQHIFRVLAQEHRTIWVNTIGMRSPQLSVGDLKKAVRKVSNMLWRNHSPSNSYASVSGDADSTNETTNGVEMTVCSPPMLPFHRPRALANWSSRSIEKTVRRALEANDMNDVCLVTTVPNVHDVLKRLGAASVVYYCVDDFSEWPGMEKSLILEMEKRMLPSVDKVVCTSQALFDRFDGNHPTWLLTHGVDLSTFRADFSSSDDDNQTVHPCLQHIPEPRIGYFGLLDARTDKGLVVDIARALPRISFVFTGPTEEDRSAWSQLPNVHLTGPVPYHELPSVVRGWSACFLPYRINALTEKINPLKLKEYLAGGKPVLCSPLPEAMKLADHLRIATTTQEWVLAIEEATDGAWDVDRDRTAEFLDGESWEDKAVDFLKICEAV